jgi:IS30 family transposase
MKQSYSLLNDFQTKKEKSATKIAKDIGVNPNTICRWLQERRINQLWRSHEWSRQIGVVTVID